MGLIFFFGNRKSFLRSVTKFFKNEIKFTQIYEFVENKVMNFKNKIIYDLQDIYDTIDIIKKG